MSLLNGIGGAQGLESATLVSENRTRAQVSATNSQGTNRAQDAATLSAAGELLTKALDASDVRTAKVDALRQSIEDGIYSVPSIDVAGKIVDSLSS